LEYEQNLAKPEIYVDDNTLNWQYLLPDAQITVNKYCHENLNERDY